jgi:hypothetical protein
MGIPLRRRTSPVELAGTAPHPLFHRYIDPLDPTSVEHPPTGEDWIHEIRFDGYRAQIHKGKGRVTVFSRKDYNWTDRFGLLGELAEGLPADSIILDGEVVFIGSASACWRPSIANKAQRCIVPATAFAEPDRNTSKPVVFRWFRRIDGEPFFFAGIWRE